MIQAIHQAILAHDKIIVARHKNPDLDAYGSQFGMYYALKNAFPEKQIYAIGDTNGLNRFEPFEEATKELIEGSLYLMLDTVASQMIGNDWHTYAKTVVLIDHHQNDPDIPYNLYWKDTTSSSTSELVFLFLEGAKIPITPDSARAIFMGIVGDTGRFMFSTSSRTLLVASKLAEIGVNMKEIYGGMYTESLSSKQMKAAYFHSITITPQGVGYRKNDQAFLDEFHVDAHAASRGLVSQMSGIEEIPIWVNFTYDKSIDQILCEIRSRDKIVLDVAKAHGGGGHPTACGCRVATWEETDVIINELNQLLEEKNHG